MRTTIRRAGAVGAGTVLLLGLGAAPGQAAPDSPGKHLEFERFHEQFTYLSADDPEWGCPDLGFDVQADYDLSGVRRFSPRGKDGIAYFHETVRGTVTWRVDQSSPEANDHTYTNVFSVNDKDFKIEVVGDRLYITVQGAGGGAWYVDGERAFRDPGANRFQFSILHNGTPADPFDDPEDSWRFEGDVKPSTGLNETEGRDFCADLETFLMPEA